MQQDPSVVSTTLAAYGQYLYGEGAPRGHLVYAILGVVDLRRDLRRHLQSAWDVADTWQGLLPLLSHLPMPAALLRAMASLAIIWGWKDIAFLLLLGFAGCMRPGELMRLRSASTSSAPAASARKSTAPVASHTRTSVASGTRRRTSRAHTCASCFTLCTAILNRINVVCVRVRAE